MFSYVTAPKARPDVSSCCDDHRAPLRGVFYAGHFPGSAPACTAALPARKSGALRLSLAFLTQLGNPHRLRTIAAHSALWAKLRTGAKKERRESAIGDSRLLLVYGFRSAAFFCIIRSLRSFCRMPLARIET